MKLQTKINIRFLSLLLVVFLAAGIVLYFLLGLAVNHSFDNTLRDTSKTFKERMLLHSSADVIRSENDKSIIIKRVEQKFTAKIFKDTLIADRSVTDMDNYREMAFGVTSNGRNYKVILLLSKYETEDMVALIFYFMLGFFAFIVLILFFLNRWLSSSMWTPFYKTIDQLNTFSIDRKNNVDFKSTDVYEFEQLNLSLKKMMLKIQTDYYNLKEFTENASHEIQTPIAIIKSKLEHVLQDKTLETKQYEQIQLVYESANRLSKLNEALLLLSKIENLQFPDMIEIDLCELLKQRLEFIEELIEFKKIEIILHVEYPYSIKMNAYLAEILINNLLGNAVKHNREGGQITITSTNEQFVISNTGSPLSIDPEKLFQRFQKQNTGNESTGLGLAIASEICSKSGLTLQYRYLDGIHNLIVSKSTL
jgi:signal transduction histidine kinase